MSNSIQQAGVGNLAFQDIHGSSIEVTQILGKSYDYQELLERLGEQKELLSLTPEEKTERRLKISSKVNELEDRIEQFKRDVLTLAKTFERVDINTERLRRAKEFFDKGALGEARAVLEVGRNQMLDEQTRLLAERKEYETEVLPKLKHNSEEFLVLALTKRLDYTNPRRYAETCENFERSISSFATHDNLFQYAEFLRIHNQFSKAERYYEQILEQFASKCSPRNLATTLNSLGIVYGEQNDYGKALQAYEEALAIRRKLAADNPQAYLPTVAETLNNLGNVYRKQNDAGKALQAYEEALAISRKLAAENPQAYLPDVARTLNNLGIVYDEQNDYGKALQAYEEALAIRRKLAADNPQAYLPDVAATLNNLGVVYGRLNDYGKALQAYEEALAISRKLAADNPQAYLPTVAETLNNLGVMYDEQNDAGKALQAYEEALAISRKLAADNPTQESNAMSGRAE
jgi:tetratricopeptide (TPR) repeat protein